MTIRGKVHRLDPIMQVALVGIAAAIGLIIYFLVNLPRSSVGQISESPHTSTDNAQAHSAAEDGLGLGTSQESEPLVVKGSTTISIHDLFASPGPFLKPPTPAKLYANAVKSVVIIHSFRQDKLLAIGSGFILDDVKSDQRVVVTNEHVIRGSSALAMTSHDNETAIISDVLAICVRRDLAVLPVPASFGNPGLAKSIFPPQIGNPVFAVGSPHGLEFTFTSGSVSQFRKRGEVELIQTDVSLSSGSSGGPLLNEWGMVIGVNSSGLRPETGASNLNFAVSIREAIGLMQQLSTDSSISLTQLDGYNEWNASQVRPETLQSPVRKEPADNKADTGRLADIQRLEQEKRRLERLERSRRSLERIDRMLEDIESRRVFAKKQWGKLNIGMKLHQVESILGRADEQTLLDSAGILRLVYKTDFGNGYVTIKEYQGIVSWTTPYGLSGDEKAQLNQ